MSKIMAFSIFKYGFTVIATLSAVLLMDRHANAQILGFPTMEQLRENNRAHDRALDSIDRDLNRAIREGRGENPSYGGNALPDVPSYGGYYGDLLRSQEENRRRSNERFRHGIEGIDREIEAAIERGRALQAACNAGNSNACRELNHGRRPSSPSADPFGPNTSPSTAADEAARRRRDQERYDRCVRGNRSYGFDELTSMNNCRH